jgi:cytochrome c556
MVAGGLVVAFIATAGARQMTDDDYDKIMKSVGAANGAMRKAMSADPVAASAEARKLVEAFKGAAAFWKQRKVDEAAGWAAEAMTHAAEVDKALTAKNMDSANEHLKQLGGMCQTCHGKYREKTDAGFAIKKQ